MPSHSSHKCLGANLAFVKTQSPQWYRGLSLITCDFHKHNRDPLYYSKHCRLRDFSIFIALLSWTLLKFCRLQQHCLVNFVIIFDYRILPIRCFYTNLTFWIGQDPASALLTSKQKHLVNKRFRIWEHCRVTLSSLFAHRILPLRNFYFLNREVVYFYFQFNPRKSSHLTIHLYKSCQPQIIPKSTMSCQ